MSEFECKNTSKSILAHCSGYHKQKSIDNLARGHLYTLVKDWTFGPRQVLDFGAEKYILKCYELYEAKIESFQA